MNAPPVVHSSIRSAPDVARAPQQSAVDVLVARARAARLQQDSMLSGYEAEVHQRLSAGMGVAIGRTLLGPLGRNRLAARVESVARVGWSQTLGAWGEVLAARSVVPIIGQVKPESENEDVAIVLPYYPGRDRLWPTGELQQALSSHEDWIVHPLVAGADSMYDFTLGDSLNIRLPDRRIIRVREIRVQPRRPASRFIVGSLWVDVESGSLVRAAYRPSLPMDLWPFIEREVGRDDRDKVQKFGPFTGTIREIIVDHGLYEGRFWLPRTRIATAEGTATGGRINISIEQTFRYDRVTALPPGEAPHILVDTISDIDPRTGRVRYPTYNRIEERTSRCRQKGDTNAARWSSDSLARDGKLTRISAQGIRVRVLMPCDHNELITSPLLPPSIYSAGEELFPETNFDALRSETESALGLSKQAKWNPQPLQWYYGIDRGMVRYNRIEGLSAGVAAERILGNGYTGGAWARIGTADLHPLAEFSLSRSNSVTELRTAVYHRLVPSNDWGDPLSVGASISALLFGRDDGFYFRTSGAEVTGMRHSAAFGVGLAWRVFGEYQNAALVKTTWSLAKPVSNARFGENITSREGAYWGAAATLSYALGQDPRSTRLAGNTRIESATGRMNYARAMTEVTLSQGFAKNALLGVTGSAGTSAGSLPPQRMWFLGGPYTVHAETPGSMSGNAFWLGRGEFVVGNPLVRPVVFADVGWAGARQEFARSHGTLSAVGVGASMMDGLVRFDIARGLEPVKRWRVDLYVEIR